MTDFSLSSAKRVVASVKWRWFIAGCSCLLTGSLYLAATDLQDNTAQQNQQGSVAFQDSMADTTPANQ